MKHISLTDIIGTFSILGVFGSFFALFAIVGGIESNAMAFSDAVKYGIAALIVMAISIICINKIEKEDLSEYDRL
jgi:hypothetical protein